MAVLLKKALDYTSGHARARDILFPSPSFDPAPRTLHHCIVVPGFADVHVHLREPGFSYKETLFTGTQAAARGGYTAVCAMPNLRPVPDNREHLQEETDIIARDAVIPVYPYGAISVDERGEELADLAGMAGDVCAFSDDGRGVQNENLMRQAMQTAKGLGKIVAAHCEDNTLLRGGYVHDGAYARVHGHRGICSRSEWGQIERDLLLAEETGCAYHVCHISTKESVALIREAKMRGVDVTCEVTPHHLLLSDDAMEEDGRFKMNPPLRSEEDRFALIEGLRDGTIDMIATDHAPHSVEEKARGLAKSAMGVVGLETAFPILYTKLVREGVLSIERLLELMCFAPRRRFSLPLGEDFAVFEIAAPYTVDPADFCSMGRATPFAGETVYGRCLLTVHANRVVWSEESIRGAL